MRRAPQQRRRWYRARISRCHRLGRRRFQTRAFARGTRPLAVSRDAGAHADYAVTSARYRTWLLAHSRRLVPLRPPRWRS